MLKPLDYAYFAVVIIEIYGELTQNEPLRFFTKPLLMIVLIALYATSVRGAVTHFHKLMIAALMFSWVGDVALMFVPGQPGDTELMGFPKDPNFFLVGLVGFLITHILYAIAFSMVTRKDVEPLLPKKFWVAVPLFICIGALLYLLVPAINSNELTKPFLVPVLIYTTAIATMVLFAINRFHRVNDASFMLVFIGAVLFMISDSIIAINKFLQPMQIAGVLIMALYTGGQYLIAKGCLRQVSQPD